MSSNQLSNYDLVTRRKLTNNPLVTVLRSFIPERIKEVFVLCDFLVYNCEQVYAGLRKFSEYPITEIQVNADSASITEDYKLLHKKHIKTRNVALISGFDLMHYGNSYNSIYYPFARLLVCTKCGQRTAIERADYTFDAQNFAFKIACDCGNNTAEIKDIEVKDASKIKVIRWDPKDIVLNYDPVSDSAEYYLNVPQTVVDKVLRGDKYILSKIPIDIFETLKVQKTDTKRVLVKFLPDEFYHMKMPAPAGINTGWGLPPVLSALNTVLYVNVLRKANEAIAIERMTGMRVVHPGQRTSNVEPAMRIKLDEWVNQVKTNYDRYRMDPNHMMFSPVPVEVTSLGGDGKLLLTTTELEAAQTDILLAIGIPREFVYGGLNNLGGSITLRNLENQMATYMGNINDFVQWISDRCGTWLGWKSASCEFGEFKLIDDSTQKQLDLGLFQAGLLSARTVLETHEHDYDEEQKQKKIESIENAKFSMQVDEEIGKLQNALSTKVKAQIGQTATTYDPNAVMQQAEQTAQQIAGLPYEQRRSELHRMQGEDFVMYSVVSKMLESQSHQNPDGQGAEQDQGQAQAQV